MCVKKVFIIFFQFFFSKCIRIIQFKFESHFEKKKFRLIIAKPFGVTRKSLVRLAHIHTLHADNLRHCVHDFSFFFLKFFE